VGRQVIYSWTTPEQIAELRADPTLLTRSMNADGQRGRAADYILARASYDEMAAILARPEFEKKRFGWTNAWATVMGWVDEAYGTELLEIRLRPDAWIGQLDAEEWVWAFFDVNNQPVDLATVKASPERIAAIYFLDGTYSQSCGGGTFGGTVGPGPAYREYFVCNEAMIAGWSAHTAALRSELDAGIGAITQLRAAIAAHDCSDPATEDLACWRASVVELWRRDPVSLLEGYEASLAFPNDFYLPVTDNLDALIAQLQQLLFDPDPLIHQNP